MGVSLRYFFRGLSIATAAVLLGSLVSNAQQVARELSIEQIFGTSPLTGSPPSGLAWSPDAQRLTYIDDGQLLELDAGSEKPKVLVTRAKLSTLRPKTAMSEEDRDHRARYGMASYVWSPDSKHLLFDSGGSLWYYDLASGTGVDVGFTGGASGDDPKLSPDGEYVSFVRNHGLAVIPLRNPGTPTVTVAGATSANILNGEVDWVYLEELGTRSNYFWSPDSKNIAYLQMIEEKVSEYPIVDWIPTHATVEEQHYPQPGDLNPEVRVGVVSAKGGKTYWVHIPIEQGQDYVPRFGWVDRKTLWVETLSRDQKHRRIYFANPGLGTAQLVLDISDDKFLNENFDVYVGHGCIVLTNWADGHNHIYLYRYDEAKTNSTRATLDKQLTRGDWEVADVYRVDHFRKEVIYASNEGAPLERQVWRVDFEGTRSQVSSGHGFHDAKFAPTGGRYADSFSTRMKPPVMEMCGASTDCTTFWQSEDIQRYQLRPPEPVQTTAKDGTVLYGTLLMPAGVSEPASVPLIVNPYGGPDVQTVVDRWSDSLLFDELLAQHGFAVLHADNRGMGMRGRNF